MIWIIIIGVVGYILFNFMSSLNKDNQELAYQALDDKFKVIVANLNQAAYRGNGKVTRLDKRSFNLYEDGQNQIINFHYSTGHLTITWKYKYFQKEVIHKRQFDNVRNLSIFEQQQISDTMMQEMQIVVAKHQRDVLGNGGMF